MALPEIVQHALGEFGESGLKRLIDELPPRLRHALDHAVEFARQQRDLILPRKIQARREIRSLADRHGMARHAGQRLEHDAIEHDDQQQQHGDRRADQVQRGVGHGVLAARGDLARHIHAQRHQRPCRRCRRRTGRPGSARRFRPTRSPAADLTVQQHRQGGLRLRADHLHLRRRQQPAHDHHAAAAVRCRCRRARAPRRSS